MRKLFVLSVLILNCHVFAQKGASFPFFTQHANYQRIIQISGFQNDCFFNAIRHGGIDINRAYLLRRLEEMRNDERWQIAVYFMVQQELLSMGAEGDDAPLVNRPYNWFIEHIRGGAPMPFHAYREQWETQIPDVVDLLAEELNFDLRITQRNGTNGLQVMRDFARPEQQGVQRVTLQYGQMGEIGHFDLVVDREFPGFLHQLYQIDGRLGEGRQGEIFRATCGNNKFALKVLNMEDNPQAPLQERNILALFNHPHIVHYGESFEHPSENFMGIVQELVEGKNLRELIKNSSQKFTEPLILDIFTQVVLAVEEVHRQRVVHGDLKLENIMRRSDGCIKLCDFGLASHSTEITHTSGRQRFCGTHYYLAPEIVRRESYGQAVDIWALGIVLHLLSEKKEPFQGPHTPVLYYRILNKSPSGLTNRSSEFVQLRDVLLNKNPALRPTAAQILQMPMIQKALKKDGTD
ncbi:MAG: protein kinase [Myxococcaceae bacterium]